MSRREVDLEILSVCQQGIGCIKSPRPCRLPLLALSQCRRTCYPPIEAVAAAVAVLFAFDL